MLLNRNRAGRSDLLLLLLPAICLALTSGATAGTLSGNVTDIADGTPLLGVTVTATPVDSDLEPFVTSSDENGDYEIPNLPPGRYRVTVTHVGFTATSSTVEIGSDSDSKSYSSGLRAKVLNLDAISVSASRRPEKILDAPAAVNVVEAEDIQQRTTLTPTEHIKGMPAVDVASVGLNQSTAVVRGFNNIFSGALLVLTDNRIARVPSLRFNAYNFIPTANEDVERIEVVSGPGSALYGPNAASGVMHVITRSPFTSQGTTVSVGGGQRDLAIGSVRHAGILGERVGYKVSAQYYQGDDWEYYDTTYEEPVIQKFRLSASGPEPVGDSLPNQRDFDIERMAGEARVDFLINDNTQLIVNGGFNRASSIELTGLGAAQAIDWTYSYAQARFNYKDLFVQGFVNMSDAGDSYLLRTGQLIVDKSRLWAGQVQHSYRPSEKVLLTYGADALLTRPNTEATINGGNEEDDDIDEIGAYVQADGQVTEKVKLVGALRVDDHNRLDDLVWSPRAAIAYQPMDNQNLRFTYNRAYSSPDNNNLYLDILQAVDPFYTGLDIRAQGVPETGFHWDINSNGARFRSPFAPLVGGAVSDFYEFNDPRFTNYAWATGRGFALNTLGAQLSGSPDSATILTILNGVAPMTLPNISNKLRSFNVGTESFDDVLMSDIVDIERLKPTVTQTFEIGYKGLVGKRLSLGVDLFATKKNDFIGPLTVETPNVFLNDADLALVLTDSIPAGYAALSLAEQQALAFLDNPVYGGDDDGSPVDELIAMFTKGGTSAALGTVSPIEATDPTAVLVTYRNFGDISFVGGDISFAYHLNQNWDVGGTYSYISKNFFAKDADQVHDISLNAPKHKIGFSLRYSRPEYGLVAQSRVRFVDGFKMYGPFIGTDVESYTVVDLNAGIDLWYGTHLSMTVQNVFDNKHIEFVGAPEIGRLAIARLSRTF
ncbi:MAG: TonB-dependent receptor [Candidatus Zixiibacteriota bacterium]|nr:MAG: TonB-dependent receptor [candidate division Zixibacteria bacterium]